MAKQHKHKKQYIHTIKKTKQLTKPQQEQQKKRQVFCLIQISKRKYISQSQLIANHFSYVLNKKDHRFYRMNQSTSIGLSYAVWNLCIKLAPRPQPVLILCDNMSQLASVRRACKLHRKIYVLDQNQSAPKLTDILQNHKNQVILTTQKKMSIIMAIQDDKGLFRTILSTGKCLERQFYIKLVQMLQQKATIVIFPESQAAVTKLTKKLKIDLQPIQGELSQTQIEAEIIADIRLASQPTTATKSSLNHLLQSTSISAYQVASRLIQLEKERRTSAKSLYLEVSGYVTYRLDMNVQFNSLKYVWNFLRQQFPKSLTEQVRSMQKLQNEKGVIFNIPEQLRYIAQATADKLRRNKAKFKGIHLEQCTNLPPLQDTNSQQYKLLREKKKLAMQNKRQLEIFIGGIPYEMDEETLRAYFTQHNIRIFLVRILKDEKGFSKGIGFALCEDKEHFERAVNLTGSRLLDRTIRVKLADQRSN